MITIKLDHSFNCLMEDKDLNKHNHFFQSYCIQLDVDHVATLFTRNEAVMFHGFAHAWQTQQYIFVQCGGHESEPYISNTLYKIYLIPSVLAKRTS